MKMKVARSRRRIAAFGALGLTAVAASVAISSPAHAGETMCEPNTSWSTVSSRTNYLQVDTGDLVIFNNSTSTAQTASQDYTFSVGTTATVSTSTGSSVNAGVAVGWFNAGAGYTTSEAGAMETSDSYSKTITQNITVPAGKKYMAYAGHSVSKAFVSRKHCNSAGTTVSTTWSGWVTGPRLREFGWKDCATTSIC